MTKSICKIKSEAKIATYNPNLDQQKIWNIQKNKIKNVTVLPEKEERTCSCMHQHNWQPIHSDGPSSVRIFDLQAAQ